jgi:hypothetical protein
MSDFPHFKKFSLHDDPPAWVERYNSTTATNTTKPDLSKIKLEQSMETAKDIYDRIVGQYHRKLAPMTYEDTIKFAQEIADKAWEAGKQWQFNEDHYLYNESKTAPNKDLFMKSMFAERESNWMENEPLRNAVIEFLKK